MNWVNHNTTKLSLVAVSVIVLIAVSTSASASTSLGVADGWNAMIFGDLSATADTEGKLAVGGNMTATQGYSVGRQMGYGPSMPESNGSADYLVVGGNLAASNWPVYGGNARVGGSVTGGVSFEYGSGNQLYSNVGAANVGIDFAAAKADLTARSQYLAGLSSTGTATRNPWNTEILLQGSGDTVVFNLVGNELNTINRHFIVDPGATVIVNISGKDVNMESWSWSVNGNMNLQTYANEADILFNFFEAETLSIASTTVPGSILAPNAHLTLSGGGINGQTIANSATQRWGGQFNNYSFDGNLPGYGGGSGGGTGAQIPSPAAVWGGLALLGSLTMRRRRAVRLAA